MRHDDQIAILRRVPGKDAAGEPIESWEALREIWANAQFPTGAAIMRAGNNGAHADAEVSIIRASFRVWADPTIDTTQRLRHLGVDYAIKATLPDTGDRRFMFLACEAVK